MTTTSRNPQPNHAERSQSRRLRPSANKENEKMMPEIKAMKESCDEFLKKCDEFIAGRKEKQKNEQN